MSLFDYLAVYDEGDARNRHVAFVTARQRIENAFGAFMRNARTDVQERYRYIEGDVRKIAEDVAREYDVDPDVLFRTTGRFCGGCQKWGECACPQPRQSDVRIARRPKLCPYHSEVIDISLAAGDPSAGFNAMSQHAWGPKHCQGEYGGSCNFKREMVSQKYWDAKENEYAERRKQREVMREPTAPDSHPREEEPEQAAPEFDPEGVHLEGDGPDINNELAEAPTAIGVGSDHNLAHRESATPTPEQIHQQFSQQFGQGLPKQYNPGVHTQQNYDELARQMNIAPKDVQQGLERYYQDSQSAKDIANYQEGDGNGLTPAQVAPQMARPMPMTDLPSQYQQDWGLSYAPLTQGAPGSQNNPYDPLRLPMGVPGMIDTLRQPGVLPSIAEGVKDYGEQALQNVLEPFRTGAEAPSGVHSERENIEKDTHPDWSDAKHDKTVPDAGERKHPREMQDIPFSIPDREKALEHGPKDQNWDGTSNTGERQDTGRDTNPSADGPHTDTWSTNDGQTTPVNRDVGDLSTVAHEHIAVDVPSNWKHFEGMGEAADVLDESHRRRVPDEGFIQDEEDLGLCPRCKRKLRWPDGICEDCEGIEPSEIETPWLDPEEREGLSGHARTAAPPRDPSNPNTLWNPNLEAWQGPGLSPPNVDNSKSQQVMRKSPFPGTSAPGTAQAQPSPEQALQHPTLYDLKQFGNPSGEYSPLNLPRQLGEADLPNPNLKNMMTHLPNPANIPQQMKDSLLGILGSFESEPTDSLSMNDLLERSKLLEQAIAAHKAGDDRQALKLLDQEKGLAPTPDPAWSDRLSANWKDPHINPIMEILSDDFESPEHVARAIRAYEDNGEVGYGRRGEPLSGGVPLEGSDLEDATPDNFRPCDECGVALVDPTLQRDGEDFVICDECRERYEAPHGGTHRGPYDDGSIIPGSGRHWSDPDPGPL